MIQNILLGTLVILCVLLIISIIRKPFDEKTKNPCRFKILPPKYFIKGNKKIASFNIVVEKKHRYFIHFPMLFKVYSDNPFKSRLKIFYSIPNDGEEIKRNMILNKMVEFTNKTKEYIVYITDIIMGKIMMEVELEITEGDPIIVFEIMENNSCTLVKEHKLELKFPLK
jgi:hypothetical protein